MPSGQKSARTTGTEYEEKAAAALARSGYQILERNFRCRQGEIDIIARDRGYLVFVEVKYRTTEAAGGPRYAVDLKKQRRISRTALYYLYRNGLSEDTPCRFDVVVIVPGRASVLKDAFPFIR